MDYETVAKEIIDNLKNKGYSFYDICDILELAKVQNLIKEND